MSDPTRRDCLQALAAAALGGVSGEATAADLPPIRAITRGPRYHWQGYYDKQLFDPSDRYVLANQIDFEHRSPRADDRLRVGLVDLGDGDRWQELGSTLAWNWQQGCMLQWLPGAQRTVVYNDREDDRFVCRVLDLAAGTSRTIPHPVYCFSPDGHFGLSTDFRRLNDMRPGYGYTGLPDPNAQLAAPSDAGLWRVDLTSGEQRLIFSYAQAAALVPPEGWPAGAKHWFNHLLCAPDGRRFVFLHRWRAADWPMGRWSTRMITLNVDGSDPFVLIPSGKVSHFVWRDATHITAYAGCPPTNDWHFAVFTDRTQQFETVGDGVLHGDGHITHLPGTGDAWVLNDAYPDAQRLQHLHLYHLPTRRRVPLADLLLPREYQGEWRCDLHPLTSRNGRQVLVASPHEGRGRQLYLVDITKMVGPPA